MLPMPLRGLGTSLLRIRPPLEHESFICCVTLKASNTIYIINARQHYCTYSACVGKRHRIQYNNINCSRCHLECDLISMNAEEALTVL